MRLSRTGNARMCKLFRGRIDKRLGGIVFFLGIVIFLLVIFNPLEDREKSFRENASFQRHLNTRQIDFIIDPAKLYHINKNSKIVFVIPTRPTAFAARDAVRNTWGNSANLRGSNSTIVFLVGVSEKTSVQTEIDSESAKHRDILQANFLDSYFNLTLKSVIMLNWVSTKFANADYLIKVDDDIYIYHENLLRYLSSRRENFKREIVGHLVTGAKPIRDNNHKWFIGRDEFEGDAYPNYVLGGCYLMTGDLVGDLFSESQTTPLFPFEDLYVTGILGAKTNARLTHNSNFNGKISPRCRHPTKIIDHGFTPEELIQFHEKINDPTLDMRCEFRSIWNNLIDFVG